MFLSLPSSIITIASLLANAAFSVSSDFWQLDGSSDQVQLDGSSSLVQTD